jgi:zinc and cadmium transporter
MAFSSLPAFFTSPWSLTLASVVAVSAISFVGVLSLSMSAKRLTSILLYLVSFSAGAFFGDVFFHLLPEIAEAYGFTFQVSLWILAGIVFSFAVEKFVRWRHCHTPTSEDHPHPVAIMNLVGDGLHNLIDGMIIAASYLASIPLGIATTIAVVLHEIPQEIGDFGVLLHGGFSRKKALIANFLTACLSILGAIIALLLSNSVGWLTAALLPFAVGGFLYIAGSDLLPELHDHVSVKTSVWQLVMFVAGMAAMALLLLVE